MIGVGIIDSGVAGDLRALLADGRSFDIDQAGAVTSGNDLDDATGHGSEITRTIAEAAGRARLVHARAFGKHGAATPLAIAAALDWLTAEGVCIVNMSFGLTADRAVLRDACGRATDAGVTLVAAAPAQGAPCFPAGYPGVIAVSGDARCARGEVSVLDPDKPRFGTWCASPERGGARSSAGASIAAAHFTGLAARWLACRDGARSGDLAAHFRSIARYRGAERRGASPGTVRGQQA